MGRSFRLTSPENRFADDRAAFVAHVGSKLNRRKVCPDPWQEGVLKSGARQKILNTSRQVGKSTVIGGLCLHKAIYEPESQVYVFAPTEKQAKETFAKIARFYRAYLDTDAATSISRLRSAVRYGSDPARGIGKMHLALPNGSRVEAMPATEHSSRGFTPDLLVIDEAAFARNAFYDAIRPSLAVSRGDIVLASTPYGKRGFFYEEFRDGEDWDRYEVPATDCPRIAPEFLRAELRRMGERHYLQEYFAQFLDTDETVFQTELIDEAFADEEVLPLWTD